MNSMMEERAARAAGNSILSSVAPAVVLVPMLNTGRAPDILAACSHAGGRPAPLKALALAMAAPQTSPPPRTSARIVVLEHCTGAPGRAADYRA